MANPAFDAVSSKAMNAVSSDSFSHTPVGTPTCALLTLHIDRTTADGTTPVTYGGQAMTFLGAQESSNGRVEFWFKDSPLSGIQTVAYTFAAACNGLATCRTYTGTTTRGSMVGATGTSTTPSVAVSGVGGNDLVVDAVVHKNGSTFTGTAGGGQTERYDTGEGNGNTRSLGSDGTGLSTMSWTMTGSATWAIAAFAFIGPTVEPGGPGFGAPVTIGRLRKIVLGF